MRELHLFAGIGGGILGGMLLGHRCVGAVEIDPYKRGDARAELQTVDGAAWRAARPRLLRLVSRAAARVDARQRIGAAGNAQVPQVAAAAFSLLMAQHTSY